MAELIDESPTDEALHLRAAMQYCGFRSVVGTTWAMAGTDGRDLAEELLTNRCSLVESEGYIIMRECQRHFEAP